METDLAKIVTEMLNKDEDFQVYRLGSESHELAVEIRVVWIKELSTGKTDVRDGRFNRAPGEALH